MGLVDIASGASVWRGYDYYEDRKVVVSEKINDFEYRGVVIGSGANSYSVIINIGHPRKSKWHGKGTFQLEGSSRWSK